MMPVYHGHKLIILSALAAPLVLAEHADGMAMSMASLVWYFGCRLEDARALRTCISSCTLGASTRDEASRNDSCIVFAVERSDKDGGP